MANEDLWNEVVEETTNDWDETTTEQVEENNNQSEEVDLSSLFDEEQPTQPTNFISDNKEEEKDDENNFISEEEIKEIEKSFQEFEQEIEAKDEEINNLKSDIEKLERWIELLWNHPQLWVLAEKVIKWEEVDIPWYLKSKIDEELSAIPKLSNIEQVSIPKTKKTLQDELMEIANAKDISKQFNF